MVFAKHKSFRGTPKSSVTPNKTRNEVLTGQSKTASCCMPGMMYSTSLSVRYGASICLWSDKKNHVYSCLWQEMIPTKCLQLISRWIGLNGQRSTCILYNYTLRTSSILSILPTIQRVFRLRLLIVGHVHFSFLMNIHALFWLDPSRKSYQSYYFVKIPQN